MNNFSSEILSFFTDASISPSSTNEDFMEVKASYVFDIDKIKSPKNDNILSEKISERDNYHISVLKDGNILENYDSKNGSLSKYIGDLKAVAKKGDRIELRLTIIKNKIDNVLSVYNLTEFSNYLKSLSFSIFLKVFEKCLGTEKLILECQEDNLGEIAFETKTIKLTSKNVNKEVEEIEIKLREEKIYNATTLCHWDIEKKLLLPEDLYPTVIENANDEIVKIFKKTCTLYTLMFIFDYSSLKEDKFLYKLNGYKTFGEEISISKNSDISIDIDSVDLFYKIYQWIYVGGNINDKISIARNIISLNYNPKTLQLSKTSFDSILSNYKIYERQNVKQYIEVRNKLSEILIGLQEKIDKIVDGFIGDFKKNLITIISFFISVIAIRVVSKGDFIGGFTNEIIILSYSFLLISIGILFYSRWEFSKRIALFDKHYEQLKERYKELLSEDEINKIFDQSNPKNLNSKSFVDGQKKFYTILWFCSILVLSIAIAVIYFINNPKIVCIALSNSLEFLICCIKNIFQ